MTVGTSHLNFGENNYALNFQNKISYNGEYVLPTGTKKKNPLRNDYKTRGQNFTAHTTNSTLAVKC